MFWAIFLIGNDEAVIIYPFKNQLTLVFGYLILGMFHISNITVLLNMLIAMMTRSYESILVSFGGQRIIWRLISMPMWFNLCLCFIQHHSDTEWKFSRSQLYMEFIRDSATLPVPFNIIPMPTVCYNVVKSLKNKLVKSSSANHTNEREMPTYKSNGTRKVNNLSVIDETGPRPVRFVFTPVNRGVKEPLFWPLECVCLCVFQNGHVPNGGTQKRRSIGGDVLTYQKVVERVVKRFLLHNNRENEDIRESDFDEIKQDIQMIRFEMITDIRRTREDQLRYVSLLHNGLSLLGEFMIMNRSNEQQKYDEMGDLQKSLQVYRSHERAFVEEMDDILNTNKQLGIVVNRQNTQVNDDDAKKLDDLAIASATKAPTNTTSSATSETNDLGQGVESELDLRSPSDPQMGANDTDTTDNIGDVDIPRAADQMTVSYSDLNVIKDENEP